jgi:hypothetical protein
MNVYVAACAIGCIAPSPTTSAAIAQRRALR